MKRQNLKTRIKGQVIDDCGNRVDESCGGEGSVKSTDFKEPTFFSD